jgi:hypothetical protein
MVVYCNNARRIVPRCNKFDDLKWFGSCYGRVGREINFESQSSELLGELFLIGCRTGGYIRNKENLFGYQESLVGTTMVLVTEVFSSPFPKNLVTVITEFASTF